MIFGVDSRDYRSHRSVGFLPENPYFYKFLTADETLRSTAESADFAAQSWLGCRAPLDGRT